ncbi:RNA polymerase, sigma 28 subunit, FliA/WhiG subfamily [Melioribacter roseus P3M-2]|uniref:RNA polymerase, sigma 28 subunit, FliA/WhiG subfamily n=1 Tax=Melioribacter roseus (strain DSM 23840 / JCM 17771 / VKM B-2668 / P3M-2) TaxID=1191523 RepID=I6Z877_MELRP|nr:sigma-70 family RNA polymerase sigma factor [Melioribacter roseus]AFN75380.1 RNA polymerase, sigma 28 subunit, FliA/WhiG subfamily [Melioribacter roseus P3M-2]
MNKNEYLWESFKAHPSPELKKKIILNYINLVHYVIHKTNLNQSELFDRRDFFQFGIEGLSEAIDRFDPDYGTKFETYAIQRIRGKIYDEIRKYSHKYEMIGEPEPVTTSSSGTVSLNSNYIEEEGMQMYEMMADDSEEPLQILEKNEMKERLVEMIKQLSDRDRMIITLYYYEELNYQEIAKVLNITVSRVSQLHSKIMKILKQKLSEKNG